MKQSNELSQPSNDDSDESARIDEFKENLKSESDDLVDQSFDEVEDLRIARINLRKDNCPVSHQYDNSKITKLLRLVEMVTSVAVSHKKMVDFILKFIREKELALLANHLLLDTANHPPIIVKIFYNLLSIGLKLEQFDNVFESLGPITKNVPKNFKTDFSDSKFLEVCFSLLCATSKLKRHKKFTNDEQMNKCINELFKKILRSNSQSELDKCKLIIESKLDLFINNMQDYSEEESQILFSLFEGGEYLDLKPGTYAKTTGGKNIIIVGFSKTKSDLSKESNRIVCLEEILSMRFELFEISNC